MWHDGFTYVHNDSLPLARIKIKKLKKLFAHGKNVFM